MDTTLVSRRTLPPLRLWVSDVASLQPGFQIAFTLQRAYDMLIEAGVYNEDTFTPEYAEIKYLSASYTIPEVVFAMQYFMKTLNAEHLNMKTIPDRLRELRQLTELSLRFNNIQTIPRDLFNSLSSLTSLFLSHNKLHTLPDLHGLRALSVLDISSNNIQFLPESIGQLTQLHILNAHHNKITELPESMISLRALKTCSFAYNLLHNLPESVTLLSTLTSLDLSNNRLDSIPREFLIHLQDLCTLNASGNELTSFPFTHHEKLKCLKLAQNAIAELDDGIGWMVALKVIDLSQNRIQDIPESILQLGGLYSIHVYDNQLSDDALEILSVMQCEYGTNVMYEYST